MISETYLRNGSKTAGGVFSDIYYYLAARHKIIFATGHCHRRGLTTIRDAAVGRSKFKAPRGLITDRIYAARPAATRHLNLSVVGIFFLVRALLSDHRHALAFSPVVFINRADLPIRETIGRNRIRASRRPDTPSPHVAAALSSNHFSAAGYNAQQ